MNRQLTINQEEEWKELICWWEHSSDALRDICMNKFGHGWQGNDYERYIKLKKMNKYVLDERRELK